MLVHSIICDFALLMSSKLYISRIPNMNLQIASDI